MAAAGNGLEGVAGLVVVLHVEIAPDPDVFGILLLGAGNQAIRDAVLAGRIVGADFSHVAADGGHCVIFLLLGLVGADAAVRHLDFRHAGIAQVGIGHAVPAVAQPSPIGSIDATEDSLEGPSCRPVRNTQKE